MSHQSSHACEFHAKCSVPGHGFTLKLRCFNKTSVFRACRICSDRGRFSHLSRGAYESTPPASSSRDPAASSHARLDGEAPGEGIPFNTLHPVPFESPLFKGRVVFNIAHLKPTPRCPPGTDPHKHVLNGCHGRAMECIIQGRFKRRVRFDEVRPGSRPVSVGASKMLAVKRV